MKILWTGEVIGDTTHEEFSAEDPQLVCEWLYELIDDEGHDMLDHWCGQEGDFVHEDEDGMVYRICYSWEEDDVDAD